ALLTMRPEFRFVLIVDQEQRLFGYFEADALHRVLDPENQVQLMRDYGGDDDNLPGDADVGRWREFAEMLNAGDRGWLAGLPGFVSAEDAVKAEWTSLDALAHMVEGRAEQMPAVDEGGRLAGMVDRTLLTAQVVLELAAEPR
ncbi:MAG TPA: hypothetical protein VFR34_14785, partial [Paracoccaceae bacterium]|nr:hypothetical protein [Paracoccaceae bacterium]